jgi:hypothetical protein
MERWSFDSQQTDKRVNGRPDNLYQPMANDGGERGRNWSGHTRETSLYNLAFRHPYTALAAFTGLSVGVAVGAGRALQRPSRKSRRVAHSMTQAAVYETAAR